MVLGSLILLSMLPTTFQLDALEYIHDKGYCHADIKAANILLGYNGGKTDFNQVCGSAA